MTNLGMQNISFGMKIPTQNVIELASKGCIRRGQFDDNIETIHKLISYKTDLYDRGGMGCAVTLDAVSAAVNKQFPQIKPILKKIKGILKFAEQDEKLYMEKYNKIMKKAEKTLGKELDVSEAEIEKAVGMADNPFSAIMSGLI